MIGFLSGFFVPENISSIFSEMARVCVIGAGAAGLCAARHLLAEPCVSSIDVLEQAAQLGGTWVYTENVGYDDFGLPIHTSMYKSLR